MIVFGNAELESLLPRERYRASDLQRIEAALRSHGTLTFSRLSTGLFSASPGGGTTESSGYANVWVRDNVYVAYAHHLAAQTPIAAGVARALLRFFDLHRHRFTDIISGAVDPNDVQRRPHVRFDGQHLAEIATQRWSHAQNDALGYFLWLYAKLARIGAVPLDEKATSTLALFPRYFRAIRFWQDEDSGHWEEVRKVSASSVGTVVAGLREWLALAGQRADAFAADEGQLVDEAAALLELGQASLERILPQECAQLSVGQNRRYDAALLFLLFPLAGVEGAMAELILHDIDRFLKGEIGIRRYLGDSYWAPDYEERLPAEDRTRDFSDDMAARDVLLERIGDEAQWCIFDPVLSACIGHRFATTGAPADLERQTMHFNRALAQITPEWRCPELYYLKHGRYVPNAHVPLQWTQANLLMAIEAMRTTVALA